MKSRDMLVTIRMKTDIPMKFLEDKRRWQALLDMMHRKTKNPLADYAIVKNVVAVKLNEHSG